jgi:hypothetical protein
LKFILFSTKKNEVYDWGAILKLIFSGLINKIFKESATNFLPVFIDLYFPNIKRFILLELKTRVPPSTNCPKQTGSSIRLLDVDELLSLQKNVFVVDLLEI